MPRPPKSPQEKKALSLEKDRRNRYGNSDKAARKAIPLRKALEARRTRHATNQALAVVDRLDEAAADLIESSARHDVERVGGWTKSPDEPLQAVIESKQKARKTRVNRKARMDATTVERDGVTIVAWKKL